MAEEHHHHHLFGHHKHDDEAPPPAPPADYSYSEDAIPIQSTEYYDGPPQPSYTTTTETTEVLVENPDAAEEEVRIKKHEKHTERKEHLGEALGAAAGAYALYERHEEKKDTEHAGRHKVEERIAEAVAVGAGGYALHEHHEKKGEKKEEEEVEGHKKHHFF